MTITTTMLLAITIEHDGDLTPKELSETMGVWVETLLDDIPDSRTIETTSDEDQDTPVEVRVLGCTGAMPLPVGWMGSLH